MSKPYFKLHFFVVIVAFTAVLGELISLPAHSLVLWRTGIAAILLGFWLRGKVFQFDHKRISVLTGVILGAHWMTFFGAVKLANISICLAGMATTTLFAVAVEAYQERRLPYKHEIWLSLMIIPGIILIAGVESGHLLGLLCGVLSAFFAAVFTVINKTIVRKGASVMRITFYEMLGATLACGVFSLLVKTDFPKFMPLALDWLWIGILAIVCTVYAFSLSIELLKSFSAYESTLAFNLEPVYGIILAALIFAEHEKLHPLFFIGATTIFLANLLNPIFAKRMLR